ncbi:MAG: T9SS type A sorting domain-containing protein [Bacteroidota bacterium]
MNVNEYFTMKNGIVYVFLLLFSTSLFGQQLQLKNDIEVREIDGRLLSYPWTGGIDNPKVSNIDFNFDGREDIVVMDEGSIFQRLIFIPLMNMGNGDYEYAPKYEANFANCECRQEGIFIDYNKDSIADLFCISGGGNRFRVYQGYQACEDSIGFTLVDSILFAEDASGGQELVSMSKGDVPAIGDVDFDGDIDIIATQVGFNRLTWYRNLSMETMGNCDSLMYQKVTSCWGHFNEYTSNDSLFFPDTTSFACQPINRPSPTNTRHAGTTLLMFDHNGDGFMDMLLGDIGTNRSNLAISAGPTEDPIVMDAIYGYPGNGDSIRVWNYVANYWVDVNQDGLKDLVSAPKNPDPTSIENVKGMSWFENEGTNSAPIWQQRDRTFMVNDHIDAGTNSAPAFFDYNGDGKLDIIVGNFVSNFKVGDTIRGSTELHLYENIGTATQPAFQLKTRDYMSFSQNFPFIINTVPAFGDLDGDNDVDMLIGASNGRIYRFNNLAGPGQTVQFVLDPSQFLFDQNSNPVFLSSSSNPTLSDIDNDGDLDLFFGSFLGRVTFYKNVGDANNFTLQKEQDKYGGVQFFSQIARDTFTVVRPQLFDVDKSGSLDLIVGGSGGFLEVYKDAALGLTQPLTGADTVLERYLRGGLSPAVADLDGSGDPTFVIGNENGGLILLKMGAAPTFCGPTTIDTTGSGGNPVDTTTTFIPNLNLAQAVNIYPNPTQDIVNITFEGEQLLGAVKEIRLLNTLGQGMRQSEMMGMTQTYDLQGVAPGIYLIEIKAKGQRIVRKLVIE